MIVSWIDLVDGEAAIYRIFIGKVVCQSHFESFPVVFMFRIDEAGLIHSLLQIGHHAIALNSITVFIIIP